MQLNLLLLPPQTLRPLPSVALVAAMEEVVVAGIEFDRPPLPVQYLAFRSPRYKEMGKNHNTIVPAPIGIEPIMT